MLPNLIPALAFRIHRREDGSLCQLYFLCGNDSAGSGAERQLLFTLGTDEHTL